MEEQNQGPVNQQPQTPQPIESKPIVEPSQAFIEEMKLSPTATPTTPNPQPVVTQQSQTPLQPTTPYQQPVQPIGAPTNNTPTIPAVKKQGNPTEKLIIALIILFGVYLAASSVIGLVGGIKLLSFGIAKSATSEISAIDVVYLIVGVGIILRKEIARIAYVVLAIIGICLSFYGGYRYAHIISEVNNARSSYAASTQQQISQTESDKYIPANQKAEMIQEDKQNEKSEFQFLSNERGGVIFVVVGFIISILPLVFLTRPSVKEEFA